MFVAINNKDVNIYDVEKWINDTRKANGGVISPEFAMEILSKTNHLAHIKKVLRNIKEKCDTPEKIAPYREFILSCVDGREMSNVAMGNLREMAKVLGEDFEKEFDDANSKPKFYDAFDCDNAVIVKSKEEFEALRGENLKVYFDADKVDLRECDLSKVKALKFREGAEVDLCEAKNLPKDLDFSQCSVVNLFKCNLDGLNLKFREGADVNLNGAKNLPEVLDVSMCSCVALNECRLNNVKELKVAEGLILRRDRILPKVLDFSACSKVCLEKFDLDDVKEIKFREGAEVNLCEAKNLPKDLDVSRCSYVNLRGCDLGGLNLKFREGAEVVLVKVKNLPKDLDLSMCSKVYLSGCNLEGLDLKFREGAEIYLGGETNLPEVLDLSMCSRLDLTFCNFFGVKEIKFRKGAEVNLYAAKNLPECLDLSMCDDVNLAGCDLSGVKELRFKDKKQERKFKTDVAKHFSGKVVYVGEENKVNTMSVNGGMEM